MIDRRSLLDERARRLARVTGDVAAAQPAERLEVVTFALSGERYAIETYAIREIVPLAGFTPVPGGPRHLFGVINLRSDVVAVFDPRPLLGLEQRSISDLCRVIVMGIERAEFGVLVDAADEVIAFAASTLFDPLALAERHSFVRGVATDTLVVLDGRLMLNDARFSIDDGR
jgi:purine-binding chemotaxis protein CheW